MLHLLEGADQRLCDYQNFGRLSLHAEISSYKHKRSKVYQTPIVLKPHRSQITDTERGLCKALSAIREIKNLLLPVNYLPPEIFAEVFRYRDNEKELIAATHVCRYWRSCLSSVPSLWTNFCFKNFDLARTYLKRCKSATISIRIPTTWDPSLFEYIVHSAAKVGSICLRGPSYVVIRWLLGIDKPLLSLRSLELAVWPEGLSEGLRTLPSGFLDLQAPSLRSLVLRGVYPPAYITLPNLSVLTLQFYENAAPICLDRVVALLSQAPNLQELDLFIGGHVFFIDPGVVTLGHLERFRLVVGGILPIHIFSPMRLPRLQSLTLTVALYMNNPSFTLANFLPPSHCLSLANVDQMLYDVDSVVPSSRVVTFGTQRLKVVVCVHPNPHSPIHDRAFMGWLSNTSPVPLAQIKRVCISGSLRHGEIPFTAFKNLEVLQSRRSSNRGIFVALSSRSADGLIPCPRLRKLEVQWECNVDMGELVRLVDLARKRMEEGNRFDVVRVAGSVTCRSSLFEDLRGYVRSLETPRIVGEAEGS